jgi:RNA polymerase sigma-70 factor (ECF subfamily)
MPSEVQQIAATIIGEELIRNSPQAREADLLRRLQLGDEAAFASVVERWHGSLVRLARTFVRSREVAEEVAQETWVAMIDGLAGFEGRSTLRTWVFRILVNRAISRGQREGRSVPFSALGNESQSGEHEHAVEPSRFSAGVWNELPSDWRSQEDRVQDRELVRFLDGELEKLPPNQRAVVVLRDVEGLTAEEACNVLEVSEPNQRVLLHRGRARLRTALERHLEEKKAS